MASSRSLLELADLLGQPIGDALLGSLELLGRQILSGSSQRLSAGRTVVGRFSMRASFGFVCLIERRRSVLVGGLLGLDDGHTAEDDGLR